MPLTPAKVEFTIVPFGGAMDSEFPNGDVPPVPTVPVRIAPIPEIVFTAGFAEDEYLGYYMLEPGNLIDPSFEWWFTDGAVPQKVGGGNWTPLAVSSITGTLPTGVTYDPATTKLSFDGSTTGSEATVTFVVGPRSRQFKVRVVVPQVVWGHAAGLAALPAAYQPGGDLDSIPQVVAHQVGVTASSFYRACQDNTLNGSTAALASIILVARGTYDHDIERDLTGNDIEWRVGANRKYLMILGEPTRGQQPVFTSLTNRTSKFAVGSLASSGVNAHTKNVKTIRMYSTVQPNDTLTAPGPYDQQWYYRKTRWQEMNGKVLGDFLNTVDSSTILSSSTRSEDGATPTNPWKFWVELSTFDRCGTSTESAVGCGGGFAGSLILNGCRVYGSSAGNGVSFANAQLRHVHAYNCYSSYLVDPAVVTLTQRLQTFLTARSTSQLDAWNVRALIGRHSGETSTATKRLFYFTRSGTRVNLRTPPLYPDVTAQASPFSTIVVRFTSSDISTAGAVAQLSVNGGEWYDAGTPVQESGATWNITFAHTDFATNGKYRVRMRNSTSTSFTSGLRYLRLFSYKNANYWLVNSNRDEEYTSAHYPEADFGTRAYAPDDGVPFWTSRNLLSGEDMATFRRFIAFCDVEWDTRPAGAAAAIGANTVIWDEGMYPADESTSRYMRVPAEWKDLGVTFTANSAFRNFGVGIVPWGSTQRTQGAFSLFGVGVVPSPLPTPTTVDYLASNVSGDRPTAANVDLPSWWGNIELGG